MFRRLRAYIGEAFAAIWRNRTRSILTMLGMIIGTSSIIAVLGISRAASTGIASTLTSFGDPGISVAPDPNQDDPRAASIQYRDVRAIRVDLDTLVDSVEPSYVRRYKVRAHGVSTNTFVFSQSTRSQLGLTIQSGRRMTPADEETGAHVCFITAVLAEKLFKGSPALGETITFGGTRCTRGRRL